MGISPLKENGEGEAVHDSKKKANLLSEQFKSVFTQEDLENLPSLPQAFPSISQLSVIVRATGQDQKIEVGRLPSCFHSIKAIRRD